MRTIKFRGKRIDNGEWVYGDLTHDDDGKVSIYICHYGFIGVDPGTVGQCTGLLDSKGVKIFEGDIIKNKGILVGVVQFGEYKLKNQTKHDRQKHHIGWFVKENFIIKSLEELFYNLQENLSVKKREDQNYVEVIGNKHDNPNLISP
jgi:uncharacterized phage protein (TIGR01671 family)